VSGLFIASAFMAGLAVGLELARRAYRETARLLSRTLTIAELKEELRKDQKP
jgi:hypothetical protein